MISAVVFQKFPTSLPRIFLACEYDMNVMDRDKEAETFTLYRKHQEMIVLFTIKYGCFQTN